MNIQRNEKEQVPVEKPDTSRRRSGESGMPPSGAVDDAIWRNDEWRQRGDVERGTGYAGELDDIDEPYDWSLEAPEPNWPQSADYGPQSDFWPGEDEDEENRPVESRPGTLRQWLWIRPYGNVGVSL
jgi:hypothetical protein